MDDQPQGKVWSKGEKCEAKWSEDGQYYTGRITKLTRNDNGQVIVATVQFDGYTVEESEEVDISCLRKIAAVKKKTKQADDADVCIIDDPDVQNNSMFKPLCGQEEDNWLSEKFSLLEDDIDNSRLTKSRNEGRQRKGVVAVGGKTVASSVRSGSVGKVKKKIVSLDNETIDHSNNSMLSDTSHKKDRQQQVISDSPQPGCSNWPSPVTSTVRKHTIYMQESSDDEDSQDGETDVSEGFNDEDLEKPKFKFTPSSAKIPFCLSDPEETPVVQVPATINQYLRDYQREGIKFLYSHYRAGRGALLGDDMGLGKTVQVIGLLAALLQKKGNRVDILKQKPKFIRQMSDNERSEAEDTPHKTFLIIGPSSVLYNWMDELEVWGYFTIGKYHGSDKAYCLADIKKDKYEIVVTTYETYRDNMDDLNMISWDAVFVDEVHKIKGLQSKITKALREVSTLKRYGLTGTALQNNMVELWSILDWAQPDCLGSHYNFKVEFVDPIESGQKKDTTKRELAYARKRKQEFAKIRNKMFLRRTKKLIQDQLPKKDDKVVFCRLSPFQVAVYEVVLDHPGMKLVLNMDTPCECGSGLVQGRCHNKTAEGLNMRSLHFTFMHFFLKIANHVALIVPSQTDNRLSEYSNQVVKYIMNKFPQYFSDTKEAAFRTLSNPEYCGKMKVLQGLLSVFSKDHSKVLLFSYSTKVLDILEQYMMTTGYEYRRLDGSTSAKKRMDLVREFNKDPNIFIFLVSTKAGGIGLNLTGANRVIIFDPNWNPTHDLQAQDRAYRIGQRRNVQVYRLISAGSIEENMYLRQVYKQQLDSVAIGALNAKRYFHAIAGDRKQKGELFGVRNMYELRTGESCLTMDIMQQNEQLESGLTGYQVAKYIPSQATTKPGTDNSDDEAEKSVSDIDTSTEHSEQNDTRDMLVDLFDLNDLSSDDEEADKGHRRKSKLKASSPKKQSIKTKVTPSSLKKSACQQDEAFDSVDGNHGNLDHMPGDSSFSSVGAVFENCGVVHIHENRKVIGGSRAEDHMTRCAIQDVFELHQNTQIPAAECEPISESSSSSEEEPPPPQQMQSRGKKRQDPNLSQVEVIGSTKFLIGQTPRTIRQQQFEKLAKFRRTESLIELAEEILSSTAEGRRQILKEYYCEDNPELSRIFKDPETSLSCTKRPQKSEQKQTSKVKNNTKGRPKRIKPNPTLGVSFCDIPDSESFGTKTIVRSLSKDSEDSLDVGKKVTSCRSKKITTRARKKKARAKSKGIGQTFGDSYWNSESYSVSSESSEKDEDIVEENVRQEGLDVGQLLDEMEQNQEDSAIDNESCVDVNTSVLDDIFGNTKADDKLQRKPPPGKKKKRQMTDSVKDLFADGDAYTVCDSMESSMIGGSDLSHQEESDLVNESTLKDDSFDCFSDPQKWKKRKRKANQDVNVDKLIRESDSDFQQLFHSGKMKRKVRDEVKKDVRVQIRDDEVRSVDKTPSLF